MSVVMKFLGLTGFVEKKIVASSYNDELVIMH